MKRRSEAASAAAIAITYASSLLPPSPPPPLPPEPPPAAASCCAAPFGAPPLGATSEVGLGSGSRVRSRRRSCHRSVRQRRAAAERLRLVPRVPSVEVPRAGGLTVVALPPPPRALLPSRVTGRPSLPPSLLVIQSSIEPTVRSRRRLSCCALPLGSRVGMRSPESYVS